MERHTWRAIALVGAVALALPSHALAGSRSSCCCQAPKCYIWTLKEVEETVYTVEYEKTTKKVRVPVITETKSDVTCKVCQPFTRTVLKDVCVPDYKWKVEPTTVTVHRTHVDECGRCVETCDVEERTMACLEKSLVKTQVPVLEWEGIPVEKTHQVSHLKYDWEEKEVTVEIPVKRPKTIKRKIWLKELACRGCGASCCETPCCETSCCDQK
jgi:hypothetical protein